MGINDLNIHPIPSTTAKELIIRHHYTHKWTSCRYPLGLFKPNELGLDDLVGVAVYGAPVGRQVTTSISHLLRREDVLELTRLWVSDNEGKNTESFFLGRTFQWLRDNTSVKVLIAYSDPMYNHLGTIYQATNWLYQGNDTMLVKSYLHKVNGEILHPRTCCERYGTVKEEVLKDVDPNYERIPMKKKFRYLYILHKKDRKVIMDTLKHSIRPYPKSLENCDW